MVILIERVTRKELCASVCFVLKKNLGGFCEVILDDLLWGLVGGKGSWRQMVWM